MNKTTQFSDIEGKVLHVGDVVLIIKDHQYHAERAEIYLQLGEYRDLPNRVYIDSLYEREGQRRVVVTDGKGLMSLSERYIWRSDHLYRDSCPCCGTVLFKLISERHEKTDTDNPQPG